MGLTVEPAFLRGYAGQLDATRDGALADLAAYCDRHCRNTAGLDGVLTPAQGVTTWLADTFAELLKEADTGLRFTAKDLRYAADKYEAADAAAADRLYTTMVEVPDDY